MTALVDSDILLAMRSGQIVVAPFDLACLGTNSYDVHLAPMLRVYQRPVEKTHLGGSMYTEADVPLESRSPNATYDVDIGPDGMVLEPGELYLASTVEYTESNAHLPMLNGRSSIGRLGLSIHVTAGTGDVGFRGHWTMELHVVRRLRVHAGMPVGQLLWFAVSGEPETSYGRKPSAKYAGSGPEPAASRLHADFAGKKGR